MAREKCYSQQLLESSIKTIRSSNNLILIAPEKTGKSTFLKDIAKSLDDRFLPIVLSAENAITIESYIRSNLLSFISANLPIDNPKELFSLSFMELDSRIAALDIDDAAKQALKLLLVFDKDPNVNIEEVIRSFFLFPKTIADAKKKTAVLLIDDADRLSGIKSDKTSLSVLFDMLKELDGQVIVLASSYALPAADGFQELRLRPFTLDAAREFFSANNLALDEAALTTLYNITGGVPFYINYFGRLLGMTGHADSDSINKLVADSLENELHAYYSEKLKLLSPKELPILFCMAEHKVNTPSRISKLLNYSQTNVRRFLSIMEEKGFVTLKERGVFEIHDPVFRKWLEVQS